MLESPQGNLEFFHQAIFGAFDKNGDGRLDPDEVRGGARFRTASSV